MLLAYYCHRVGHGVAVCRWMLRQCLQCASTAHFRKDCPQSPNKKANAYFHVQVSPIIRNCSYCHMTGHEFSVCRWKFKHRLLFGSDHHFIKYCPHDTTILQENCVCVNISKAPTVILTANNDCSGGPAIQCHNSGDPYVDSILPDIPVNDCTVLDGTSVDYINPDSLVPIFSILQFLNSMYHTLEYKH